MSGRVTEVGTPMIPTEVDVLDPFAHETLAPSGSALAFTESVYAPATERDARRAWVNVNGGTVRVWFDGTAPTSTVGILYPDGSFFPVNGRAAIRGFRVIDASGTPKVSSQFGR